MSLLETNGDYEFSARIHRLSDNVERAATALEALTDGIVRKNDEIGCKAITNYLYAVNAFKVVVGMHEDTPIKGGTYYVETPDTVHSIKLEDGRTVNDLIIKWSLMVQAHPFMDVRILSLRHSDENSKMPSFNMNLVFISDAEKMNDFNTLSKEEFLRSYSYLTEEEYNETAAYVKWLSHQEETYE